MVAIALRPMTLLDMGFVCDVRNHPDTVRFLHDDRCFTLRESERWFTETAPQWYIIEADYERVGYIRTSDRDESRQTIKVGADIHPEHRRQGYALLAYSHLIAELRKDGYRMLILEVLADNTAARMLYTKLGFCPDGLTATCPRSDGSQQESIRMILPLRELP